MDEGIEASIIKAGKIHRERVQYSNTKVFYMERIHVIYCLWRCVDMYGILGDHIYELRIGCGWSMDFTARKLGVSKSTYQHWEKYGVFPSVSRLIKSARYST